MVPQKHQSSSPPWTKQIYTGSQASETNFCSLQSSRLLFVKSSPEEWNLQHGRAETSEEPEDGDEGQLQSQSSKQAVLKCSLEQHLQGISHCKPCFADLHNSCIGWQGEPGKADRLHRSLLVPWEKQRMGRHERCHTASNQPAFFWGFTQEKILW